MPSQTPMAAEAEGSAGDESAKRAVPASEARRVRRELSVVAARGAAGVAAAGAAAATAVDPLLGDEEKEKDRVGGLG